MNCSATAIAVTIIFALTAAGQDPTIQARPVPQQGQPTQQGPVPQGQPEAAQPPARVEGRTVDTVTGEPVKRVNVVLMPADQRPDSSPYSTTSDATGRFAMADITPGRYRMWAERTGYVRQEYGSRGASRMGTTMVIGPAQELKSIEFRLQPHAVITGRVTDEEGEPVAYVQVQTMSYRYMQGRRQLMPSGGSSTNDLGEFRIFGLAPGRYYLSATVRNQGMMFNAIDRTAGGTTNQPDTGFAATYYPGTHDPRSAMNIQVSAGKPLTNMDIRLVRTRTVRVRGRVANAGTNPMSRPVVMLAPRDSAFMGFGQSASTTRGADGKFEIRGVAPGSYYLIAHVMGGNSRQSARVPIDVGSTDVDGLEISVSPGQEVTGVLRIEGQGQVSPSSVHLMLQPTEFSPMLGGSPPATVKDDGSFSLRDVQPDHTYRVMVMGGQNQFYVKSVLVGQQEAKDGEITIPASTTPPLSVVVSTAGGQVTGTVKAEADASTQGATIVLAPSGNRNRNDLYKMATPDQYGKFTLASIAPGEYKLFAWDNVETGQWMDPDFLQAHENKGKSITIRENAKESIDVELLKNTNPGETAVR